MKVTILKLVCKKCGHKWVARKLNLKVCPECMRYDWMGTKHQIAAKKKK